MMVNWIWQYLVASFIFAVTFIASTTAYDDNNDDRKPHGPVISPSVDEVVLQKGQNFTFYCKGNGSLKFIQQEVPEEVLGDFKIVTERLPSNHTYDIALHLYNVDVYAVGYYACFDETINNTDFLNDMKEEPQNTEHVTYTYVYVNGTDTLIAPMREVIIVIATSNSDVVVGCRPTSPDIKVTLTMNNKPPESIKYSSKIGFLLRNRRPPYNIKCEARRGTESTNKSIFLQKVMLPPPKIDGGSVNFLEGETFSLNCTVDYQTNIAVMLTWTYPPNADNGTMLVKTNEREVINGGKLYKNLTISKATKDHAGSYVCHSENASEKKSDTFTKTFLEKGFITIFKLNGERTIENMEGRSQKFAVSVQSYPPAHVACLKDGKELPKNTSKYSLRISAGTSRHTLLIRPLTINDTGNYTFRATNEYVEESVTYDMRVKGKPVIKTVTASGKYFTIGSTGSLRCDVEGYPMPNISWSFVTDQGSSEPPTMGVETIRSLYEKTSILQIRKVLYSGNVTCLAMNNVGDASKTTELLVQEIPEGFGIKEQNVTNYMWMAENDKLTLTCVGSKYTFQNVTWTYKSLDDYNTSGYNSLDEYVTYSTNKYSIVAVLRINSTKTSQSGKYNCIGTYNEGATETQPVTVTVEESRSIEIMEPKTDEDIVVYPYQPISLSCLADAVPKPNVQWFKGGELLLQDSNVDIIAEDMNYTTVNSTVYIKQMHEENKGKYECVISVTGAEEISARRFYNLNIKEKSPFKTAYLGIIGLIFFLLLVLVVYLIWKIRKEKRFRKELAAAGLLYWKEGVTGSINPDLMIDEQAELLPYDEKFEFPPEKLKLGKQLGAGAFGVVYKAEARGIVNAEEDTTVAVKMVKKTADNMYIKALASELKIMVHLGKHINIVNLLGACTKNVGKRELIVIVEYCKFGCLHSYLQKHREVFIDQLTDSKEKSFGRVNRGFSSSSNNSANHSDYFGSNHTQATDNTFLNTSNTNRSGRKDNPNQQAECVKVSETGYVQPQWRTNYESDYSYDGRSPRPLCSRDLLCWAFQIARGMDYLASRKVLHGDLAARNVLLAEDNVVKICDFGLARSIYKNDEYQKKENSPLPVKWLAIECMTDRIFSTQSDIWSFGVVLWELFSLAKTPYPNVSLQGLLQWLLAGNRLERPQYADDRLYDLMKRCWDQKPTVRPNFAELQEILGSFLEDNVRNHYIDLNSPYSDMNLAKRAEGVEDYLAMVCAPDYNNMITPSPHHYVNDAKSFFSSTPTVQLPHDDEGYLQMSPATNQTIFSPRAPGAEFDFDARKLNSRNQISELNTHSELTPMLTLNNLPARGGSESDQEGSSSPYLNMCPRIEEESDDVFEKQNNARNNARNIAVSNPVYITYDGDLAKKPQSLASYANVSAPNGLVK